MHRSLERIVARIVAHPRAVLGVGLVLTLAGLWAALSLPLLTSRKALIRADQPVVQRLDRFLEDFGAASDLILAIDGAPRPDLEAFDLELAARLQGLPAVEATDARVDARFFLSHAWLLAPMDELQKAAAALQPLDRLGPLPPPDPGALLDAVEARIENPPAPDPTGLDLGAAARGLRVATLFLDEWLRWIESPEVPRAIAWDRLLADQPQARPLVQGNGFHQTRDGEVLFLFVHPRESSESFEVIQPFVEQVRARADALSAEWRAAGRTPPNVSLTGMPAVIYEEYTSIQRGTLFTVGTAAALILLVVLFVMRSWRRAVLVFVPMGMGILWNMGAVWLTVGHMTMVTTAFHAILFGLGVDYGIFLTSRLREARDEGMSVRDAAVRGTLRAAPGVLIAGLATTGIFFALGTVEFTGFSELGIVAGTGVLSLLLAVFTTGPALYVVLHPNGHGAAGRSAERPVPQPRAGVALAVVTVSVVLAGLGIWAGTRVPFDYDVLSLLPRTSEAARYTRVMLERSDMQSEVVILRARDLDEARRMTRGAEAAESVGQVQSLVHLFPPDAAERATVARRIGAAVSSSALLPYLEDLPGTALPPDGAARLASLMAGVSDLLDEYQEAAFGAGHKDLVSALEGARTRTGRIAAAFRKDAAGAAGRTDRFLAAVLGTAREAARVLASWRDARPLAPGDVPHALGARFFGKDGSIAIYAFPRQSVYDLDYLDRLLAEVYAVDPGATGFPTTHQVMTRMAVRSFRNGTILATLVVLIVLGATLRGWRAFLVALVPLVVGEGWMLGLLWALDLHYNYGNIIAVPLVMALALDYGVWYAARRTEQPDRSPWWVLRRTGGTIVLAAVTVLAGLGAIAFASYRAIATMGLALTLGLVACLVATLALSPAVAQLLERRKP